MQKSIIANSREEMKSMTLNVNKLIEETEGQLDTAMTKNLGKISRLSQEYVGNIERDKINAQKSLKSYWGRRKIIDYIVFVNLGITPILLILIVYLIFKG